MRLAKGGKVVNKALTEVEKLKKVLIELNKEGRVLLAYLFGSYANDTQHKRSDIDIALYLNTSSESETIEVVDKILMAVDRAVEILRLDDEDESPFIVQEALNGAPLIEPDEETLYKVTDRVLHEAENIRFKRGLVYEVK